MKESLTLVILCLVTMVLLVSHINMYFEFYKPLGHDAVFQRGVNLCIVWKQVFPLSAEPSDNAENSRAVLQVG